MTNIPASSMYSVRLGPTQSRPVSVSESPHAISSNASSEMSVNNSALCFNGSQVDDDINSEKGVQSPARMQGRWLLLLQGTYFHLKKKKKEWPLNEDWGRVTTDCICGLYKIYVKLIGMVRCMIWSFCITRLSLYGYIYIEYEIPICFYHYKEVGLTKLMLQVLGLQKLCPVIGGKCALRWRKNLKRIDFCYLALHLVLSNTVRTKRWISSWMSVSVGDSKLLLPHYSFLVISEG